MPPLGSDTKFAKAIGELVAREMRKAHPDASEIPPHRWAQKLARLLQRLAFVGLFAAAIKFQWHQYVQIATAVMAVRALSPDVADGIVKWAIATLGSVLSAIKNGKNTGAGE